MVTWGWIQGLTLLTANLDFQSEPYQDWEVLMQHKACGRLISATGLGELPVCGRNVHYRHHKRLLEGLKLDTSTPALSQLHSNLRDLETCREALYLGVRTSYGIHNSVLLPLELLVVQGGQSCCHWVCQVGQWAPIELTNALVKAHANWA